MVGTQCVDSAFKKKSMHPMALSVPCSLDSDQKDQLIEVIEKLLADKTTVSKTVSGDKGRKLRKGKKMNLQNALGMAS